MRVGPRVLLASVTAVVAFALLPGSTATVRASDEIQLQLADVLFRAGHFREAADVYRQVTETPSRPMRIHALAGLTTSLLRVGEFEPALNEATRLRETAPGDGRSMSVYGDAVWAMGLFDEAEAAYRAALELAPGSAGAHNGLARSLAARSRLDDAVAEARTALRLAPRVPEYHFTLSAIYERQRRFDAAAREMLRYVNLLPDPETSEKALWARAQVRFLRSFSGKRPFDVSRPDRLVMVPFRLEHEKVIVRGKVNGGQEMDFVLDTGAEQTVLSLPVARREGVVPVTYMRTAGVGELGVRGLQVGRMDSLEIGALKVKNVTCLIKNPPLAGLPRPEMESFSPLALGLSMIIDYGRRQIVIGKHLPDEAFDTELPLRMHRLAMVAGTLNGERPASFVVDTGGEVISISRTSAGALALDPTQRRIPLKVYGASGWDPDAFLLQGVDLQFQQIRFANIPVVVLNLRTPSVLLGFQLGGIVGHKFLSRYRVAIDLERSVLRLKTL
jgi:predicted aspartyl protease/Flp pilus assembly protein TadD